MFQYQVEVGFTFQRPVRPDQRTHTLTLMADNDHDAILFALSWIGCRPGVVMPTSARIISVEL